VSWFEGLVSDGMAWLGGGMATGSVRRRRLRHGGLFHSSSAATSPHQLPRPYRVDVSAERHDVGLLRILTRIRHRPVRGRGPWVRGA